MKLSCCLSVGVALALLAGGQNLFAKPASFAEGGALDGVRYRVLVSTDIGGTDPDDFQSMVHLLLYADMMDLEGLVASPHGPGRKELILEVIDHYERGNLRFRFCARDPKVFRYTIRSNVPALDGKTGEINSVAPSASAALSPSVRFPNWWTDDPTPAMADGIHHGARSVSQWREDFLRDFANRMLRCRPAGSR